MKIRNIILLYFFTLPVINHSQIKTIYATGGESKVNWDLIQKEIEDPNFDGYPSLYGSGCTRAPNESKASSTLHSQGENHYYSKNLHDWDPRTAWVEGRSNYGIGEYFEITLSHGASKISIFNGYQKSYRSWKNNSRVKKFKVYGDNKLICYLVLSDKMGYQSFDLDDYYDVFRFEIVEVYKGDKWKDVAISEIAIMGCCLNKNTIIQNHSKNILITDLNKGNEISTLDFKTDKLINSSILKTAKQTHHVLLKISTKDHSLELTPSHPLFTKKYGLISLYALKRQNDYSNFEELVNRVEVLIWNEKKQKSEYQKLISIEKITGIFETHTVLEIDNGKTYIANGFITSVY